MGRIKIRARKSTHVQRVILAHVEQLRVKLGPEGEEEGRLKIVRSDRIPAGAKLVEDQGNVPVGEIEIREIRDANTIRISRRTETEEGVTEESRIIDQNEAPPPEWEVDEETWFDVRAPKSGRWLAIVQLSAALTVRLRGANETARNWVSNTLITLDALGVDLGLSRDLVAHGLQTIFADALLTLSTEPDPEDGEKLAEMIAHDLVEWGGIPDVTGKSWVDCPAEAEDRKLAAIDLITMNRWFRDCVVAAQQRISQKLLVARERHEEAVKN